MNRIFLAFDGDGAGNQVGRAILNDDVQGLHDISNKIKQGTDLILSWAQQNGGQTISFGGDEGSVMFQSQLDMDSFIQKLEVVRSEYQKNTGMTLTIGVGLTLSQAGKSLLAGKLSGKDQIYVHDENVDEIVASAHQHVADGSGSEEENKLDEQYINDMDQEDPEMQEEMPDDQDQDYDQELSDDEEPIDEDMLDEDESKEGVEQNPDIDSMDDTDEELADEDMSDEEKLENNSFLQDVPEDDGQSDDMDEMPQEEMGEDPEQFEDQAPQDDEVDPMQAPEDQDQDFDQEQEIHIPESEEMLDQHSEEDDQEPDTEKEEDPQDQDQNQDFNTFNSMVADSSSEDGGQLKQQCAQVLNSFKEQKQNLEAMAQQAPELYQATLSMLQCMIEMSKALFSQDQAPQDDQEEMVEIPDDAEESQVPKQ